MLSLQKIRKDNDHRYATMAWKWARECMREASSITAFVALFQQRLKNYRTSLPKQMKDVYTVEIDEKHQCALIKKAISPTAFSVMYRITSPESLNDPRYE